MSDDLTRLSAAETHDRIAAGEVSALEVTEAHLDRIAATDQVVHRARTPATDRAVPASLHVAHAGARAAARGVDERRRAGQPLGPLAGVPLALKDVIVTEGIPTPCASRILEGWVPPYDATVTR